MKRNIRRPQIIELLLFEIIVFFNVHAWKMFILPFGQFCPLNKFHAIKPPYGITFKQQQRQQRVKERERENVVYIYMGTQIDKNKMLIIVLFWQ